MHIEDTLIKIRTADTAARVTKIAGASERSRRVGTCSLDITVVHVEGTLIKIAAQNTVAGPARIAGACKRADSVRAD